MWRRVQSFVRGEGGESFEELALAVFRDQYEMIAPYRALCDRRGRTPERVRRWQDVPPVPTSAFKSVALHTAPAREIFRSSGTGEGEERRSVCHQPWPDLYRVIIDASFPGACLPSGRPLPALALVPPRELAPDSSLSFMIDHVMRQWTADSSRWAMRRGGIDGGVARSWLGARQRHAEPALILATALGLWQLLDSLERMGLRFRLPQGSVVFETGGFKTREREIDRSQLLERLAATLHLGAQAVVREYGMTELTSQAYTRTLAGGDPDLFVCPPWLRVRALDPASLEEAAPGETGLLAFFDLGNAGTVAHVLSEDLGSLGDDGFRLAGRAAGAELRGCSLTAEELARG